MDRPKIGVSHLAWEGYHCRPVSRRSATHAFPSPHTENVRTPGQTLIPVDRTCARGLPRTSFSFPLTQQLRLSSDRHRHSPTIAQADHYNMPRDIPTEDDPGAFLSVTPILTLYTRGGVAYIRQVEFADKLLALHPVPFQFTEEDEAPASLPETGQAGEQSRIKMILGLLKKYVDGRISPS